jgi:hypothetical protein
VIAAATAVVLGQIAAPAFAHDPLSAAALLSGRVEGPVEMSALGRPQEAMSAPAPFNGRLTLIGPRDFKGFDVVRNAGVDLAAHPAIRSLPPFDFAFVQAGDALIPVARGPVAGPHPDWEWVLEPGAVWRQAGDGGYGRASIPFALMERNANCLHNGVLSFLFKPGGRVSEVYFQISSETCAYFKFNAFGAVAARYRPGPVAGAAAVRAAYLAERARRLPVRPISDLVAAHQELAPEGFALARPKDGDPPTVYGLVFEGVNYVGGCETRAGPYPYCDVLDLPSYSTAKSVVGAVGLMRLEALWPGARGALIADYVPDCAASGWQGVSFEDALNMASGHYRSMAYEADEDAPDYAPFFATEQHAAKIAFSCGRYPRQAEPGRVWVYRTADSYILGTAMQAFVRRRLGRDKDFYTDLLAEQLWQPLGLSPVLMQSRRTRDVDRQVFTGYGLIYHRDDIARLARWLDAGQGRLSGRSMLDPALLDRALQRQGAPQGLQAGKPKFRYADGFWAEDIGPALHCPHPVWAPFMSGFGGISVVLLPDGVDYYYFGDSGVFDWTPAALEIEKIRPMCP